MKVGYNYLYKVEELFEKLKVEKKKLIVTYTYSYHSVINIYHEIRKNNTLEYSYLIFEYVIEGKPVKEQESFLQDRKFIYYEIKRKMESFFYGILIKSNEFFKDEMWETYAYMMHYDNLYKEEVAYVSFFDDFVFSFKIWDNFGNYDYTTISNFWRKKSSYSRICFDIVTEYHKNVVREQYFDEVLICHIKNILEGKKQKNGEIKRETFLSGYLHDILLKTI